jgi:hypothetical protein
VILGATICRKQEVRRYLERAIFDFPKFVVRTLNMVTTGDMLIHECVDEVRPRDVSEAPDFPTFL